MQTARSRRFMAMGVPGAPSAPGALGAPAAKRALAAARALCAVCALLGLAAGGAQAAEVIVAVAANFAAPMQKIAAAFQADTGHTAVLSVGSTGRFYAQIKNGAPFQVLLSADDETPARLMQEGQGVAASRITYATGRLVQEGQGVASSRITYATGRLVLWSRDPALVDAQGQVLRTATITRLALADPKLAPYGAAAVQTLAALRLLDRLQPHFVQGESIAQAYQFVATGNAPLGFVAMSQVFVDGRLSAGSAWLVPASLHEPLRQDALLLNAGQGQPAAIALMAYLRGERARAIIRAHGYEL